MSFATLFVVALVVAAGVVLSYLLARRSGRRLSDELLRERDRQIASLQQAVATLESRIAAISKTDERPASVPMQPPTPMSKPAAAQPTVVSEEITPELLVVRAAAVTAFLGKKVRIRSAKVLQSPYEIVNPWSQQGRVIVQASHNVRSRSV
jgi:hypothetical protein